MAHSQLTKLFLALLTATLVAAQQGVLTNGNSQLPACAATCPLLNQAAQACSGTTSATQSVWICFCQSGYLTSLKSSDAGICDSVCTNPADSAQVSTWYNSNCGTDNGASEHADSGAASSSAAPASSTDGVPAATSSSSSSGSSSSNSGSSSSQTQTGDWWSTHYNWIIMLIVLAIMLPLIAFVAVCLKRRHDRKRDQIHGGFNAGITTRSAGGPRERPMSDGNFVATPVEGSGRNSPARTRDAFMPYGYAYSRSETRLGSRQAVNEHRGSPLARGDADMEKDSIAVTPEPKKKRVLVRERPAEGSEGIEMEKGPM